MNCFTQQLELGTRTLTKNFPLRSPSYAEFISHYLDLYLLSLVHNTMQGTVIRVWLWFFKLLSNTGRGIVGATFELALNLKAEYIFLQLTT